MANLCPVCLDESVLGWCSCQVIATSKSARRDRKAGLPASVWGMQKAGVSVLAGVDQKNTKVYQSEISGQEHQVEAG